MFINISPDYAVRAFGIIFTLPRCALENRGCTRVSPGVRSPSCRRLGTTLIPGELPFPGMGVKRTVATDYNHGLHTKTKKKEKKAKSHKNLFK